MNLKLLTEPGDEPISMAEAQAYLRLNVQDDSASIDGLITAARLMAETWNGRQMTQKTWDLALDYWPGTAPMSISAIANPYLGFWPSDAYRMLSGMPFELAAVYLLAPLVSVQSVTYKTSDGTVVTLVENTDFVVDTFKEPGLICPKLNGCWPSGSLWPSSAIHIQFTAGYTPDQVPRHIKTGIMRLVSEWFENRIPFSAIRFVAEPPFDVTNLFTHDKLWRFR